MLCCFQPGVIVSLLALLISSAAFALTPQDKLTQYSRQTWQTENGLPQNTVRAILQDHEGYIWLGTEGGLVRFDGLKFVVFDAENTPALKSNNITGLLEDNTGTLWIGTTEGITTLRTAEFRTYTTEDGLPANHIWSLYLDPAGVIYATTPEGTAHFSRNYFVRDAAPSQALTAQNRSAHLWAGSVKTGLPSPGITTVYQDREGSLWIGSDAGSHG